LGKGIGGERTIRQLRVAEGEGEIVGRVMKIGGPHNGKWQWSFLLGHIPRMSAPGSTNFWQSTHQPSNWSGLDGTAFVTARFWKLRSGTTGIPPALPNRKKIMRTMLIAIGVLAAAMVAAFAAEPVNMMDTKMGKVMATEKGMTLYTFDKDAKGKSNCDADCLKKWPAFHAAAKAKAEGEWSLVKAADGKEMWAYEGKPLYTYAEDKKAGEMNGDGVGGVWHIAK
jgi:predicted lipoprotein with Yx(FWY)xxD motif